MYERRQLENFASELKRKTRKKHDTPNNWREAFEGLRDYLEALSEDEKQLQIDNDWLTEFSDQLKLIERA